MADGNFFPCLMWNAQRMLSSGINAQVVSIGNNQEPKRRILFLSQLGDELVCDHLRNRAQSIQRGIPLDLQSAPS